MHLDLAFSSENLHYLSIKSHNSILERTEPILKVDGLRTYFDTMPSMIKAVDGISFELDHGETLGIVGESGSGKSVAMLSMLKLIEPPGRLYGGTAIFCDDTKCTDLLSLSDAEIAKYRGDKIGMVYQQAISAFNPVQRIRKQLREAILIHNSSAMDLDSHIENLLQKVDIEDPTRILDAYPHQLSGGQLQRCMIAMAIINNPCILIADEPTTGLDVITQKAVLRLLQQLKSDMGMSMIFISHDLGVISEMADRTIVMKKGVILEEGMTKDLFVDPQTTYAQALLHCRPSVYRTSKRLPTFESLSEGLVMEHELFIQLSDSQIQERRAKLLANPIILKTQGLEKSYSSTKGFLGIKNHKLHAVNGVSLHLRKGEVLGIVGESGSGKSTLAKLILALETSDKGDVNFNGKDLLELSAKELMPLRKKMQIIFQDVHGSLDPRMSVENVINFALSIHYPKWNKAKRKQRINELLMQVGLSDQYLDRLPHQLSGGEKQRVCIARAISIEPELLVCDECVSALDVSVQAQILNLLMDLRDDLGLSILFISHDLSVINFMCDRVLIMQDGKIVEEGYTKEILQDPKEPYTQKLIDAIPSAF